MNGEKADDLIATIATRSARSGMEVLIASQDKDFLQLVCPSIQLLRSNGKDAMRIDEAAVRTRYGLSPSQMIDFFCLIGDSIDNIPGVAGIGDKTASDLLQRYGNLETILASLAQIEKPRLREALAKAADRLLLANRQLIALQCDLPIPVGLDDLKWKEPDDAKLADFFQRFGFKTLFADLQKKQQQTGDLFSQ